MPNETPKIVLQNEKLSGWSNFPDSRSRVLRPTDISEINIPHLRSIKNAIIARGSGRSYGDASLNSGRITVSSDRLDSVTEFDDKKGILTCETGMTIEDTLKMIVPRGWFLPVVPGTQYPTLGGCFACDVHGKNHHVSGTFSLHTRWIELLTATGETVRCSQRKNKDIFQATAGGLGLTGIITKISINLIPVQSANIYEKLLPSSNLEKSMNLLSKYDEEWLYSVAWLDCINDRNALGKGIVYLGKHADQEMISPDQSINSGLSGWKSKQFTIPFTPPVSLVSKINIGLYNRWRYFNGNLQSKDHTYHYSGFFFPLDRLRKWNRLYGKSGFIQYQFMVPFDSGYKVISRILGMAHARGNPPLLAVLKRFGKGAGLLSFPMPGWTLAIDLPLRAGVLSMLDEMDRIVLDHGGRVYLAKDARLSSIMFRKMYPEYHKWLEIKRKIDPENIFTSDLSRRLRIDEEE
ncbi:MAG: FAD-binding oxidoreductase [Candidatus Electryonea clarkiae]|nr:FAD-binding oxidoreductase [Candidatus Electryonea clarkiae]MDP8286255.1 FAD-binding oxidoreductase [Candidatus Electryonea clarkiae]